jgi:prevent-host-death family protein
MSEVALRELRNDTRGVLRRVEAGEEITITANGRDIARLVPLPRRRRFLPWEQVLAHRADPGLAAELRELVPDTTDDLPDPWDRGDRR